MPGINDEYLISFLAKDCINTTENINVYHVEGTNASEHIHDFLELVYIVSGSGCHMIGGVSYQVEQGDLIFCNFGQTHAYRSSNQMKMINCLLNPVFLGQELLNSENALEILALSSFQEFNNSIYRILPIVKFNDIDKVQVEIILEMMIKELQNKQIGYRNSLKGYTHILLTKVFREMHKTDSTGILYHVNCLSPEILKYIETNCFEKLSLTELAERCFYSPAYFSRIFKECFGKTLTEYIHERRVSEAVRLLSETDMSVEAICNNIGYQDKKQFYKIFRKYIGTTPQAFRKLNIKKATNR